jgi:hypothetical protein
MAALRGVAVLAVLLLAALGVMFVFDVIPRDTLQDLSIKTGYAVGILAAAALAIGLLLKSPKA